MKLGRENLKLTVSMSALFLLSLYMQARTSALHNLSQLLQIAAVTVWCYSVSARIIQQNIRRLLFCLGGSLILLSFLQIVKYSYVWEPASAVRIMNYSYQIPLAMIPVLSFFVSLCIGRDTDRAALGRWIWLMAPAVLLSLTFMTNELHQLVYTIGPDGELSGNGAVYYLSYVWQFGLLAATFFTTVSRSRLINKTKLSLLPFVFLTAGLILFVLYFAGGGHPVLIGRVFSLQMQAIYIFMELGFWESCIQIGFIPSNSEYDAILSAASIKSAVADESGVQIYGSKDFPVTDAAVLRRSLDTHIDIGGGLRLSGKRISGGLGFWTDDVSRMNEINEELRDSAQQLSEETLLLKRENQLKQEKTAIETKNAMFDQLSNDLKPQIDRVEELLSSESDDDLRRAAGVGAYIKRKANLYILARENDMLDVSELLLSVRESLEYMKLMGISGAAFTEGCGRFPSAHILEAYEICYICARELLGLKAIMAEICCRNDLELKLQLEGDLSEGELRATELCLKEAERHCICSFEHEDGIFYVSAKFEAAGDGSGEDQAAGKGGT